MPSAVFITPECNTANIVTGSKSQTGFLSDNIVLTSDINTADGMWRALEGNRRCV